MRRLFVVAVYLILLLASHLVRDHRGPVVAPDKGQHVVDIPEYRRGALTGRKDQLAYWDEPAAAPGALETPVVILHGSPVPTPAMRPLMRALAGQARVIAPDLPGFGGTTRVVADYSFDAHARAVLELLDRLGVQQAHVVAYSMGGGVALEMERLAPQRVRSIAMVSAIGVQELELLGDHALNHTLHGLQYAFFRALQELTPHFGLLDRFPLNTSFAHNFLDSDQRPLRGILERYDGPMLILHGRADGFVPAAAAREHARIVPQAELAWLPGGHLVVIREPRLVASPLLDFLKRVEAGRAAGRANADPGRALAAIEPFDWKRHGERGRRWEMIAATLLGLATLASEDLSCISGGMLAVRGAISYQAATLGCLAGIVVGDVMLFLAGRWLGARALRRWPWRWFLSEERVERCEVLFHRRGAALVLLARFMPGLRLPTYFAAGAVRMRFSRFLLFFLAAAALWTPLLVGKATLAGDRLLSWVERAGDGGWIIALAGLLLLFATARVVLLCLTWRGRRLLLGWWRRRVRWEFWPAWMVYPPVVLYILWLGIKHRGPTVFTAVNPAMPCGGLAGESKSAILRSFPEGTLEVARFHVIESHGAIEQRLAAVDAFMEREHLQFPIVLKPDVGERGQGVAVVRDRTAAADYLLHCGEPVIAQEYVGGSEYGLFYVRNPSDPRGRIISITAKHLTSVLGDGSRSLEELILADDRAVCMAPFFLRRLAEQLGEVPASGACVRLTELGTHCRGARFTDGWSEVWSEALEARIDALSRKFDGFFFGRYDVRTPSAEALRDDGEFKVLELNGVTSESTHIFDPHNSILMG